MIHLYTYINNLFFKCNEKLQLQQNLFGTVFAHRIKWSLVHAEYLTLSDLPTCQGKLDFILIAAHVCPSADLYLFYCMLQKNLGKFIGGSETLLPLPHTFVSMQAKALLSQASEAPLSLEYWEKKPNIPPLSWEDKTKVFCVILVKCKITKFWNVNYKILTRILATPVVLSAVNSRGGSANCIKCGAITGISHILLYCLATIQVCTWVCELLQVEILDINWIFSVQSLYLLPLI